jgi:hypothetical protein
VLSRVKIAVLRSVVLSEAQAAQTTDMVLKVSSHEHRAVMRECLDESLGLRPLYDVAATRGRAS